MHQQQEHSHTFAKHVRPALQLRIIQEKWWKMFFIHHKSVSGHIDLLYLFPIENHMCIRCYCTAQISFVLSIQVVRIAPSHNRKRHDWNHNYNTAIAITMSATNKINSHPFNWLGSPFKKGLRSSTEQHLKYRHTVHLQPSTIPRPKA